ncbi:MAG TPA: uroporphyrinogen-III C-methyltransferase [Thermoleophilaceae bacterium]|nr:uroporphyrinogen-III C-methyltransferase [Thermoleophilaceae bacterium]
MIRLGTRGSALALAQAQLVAERLGDEVELVPITTSGDRARAGDKSRFVKEIEEALLAGDVDLAVHSAKDVPAVLPEGLAIVGVPERADPRDALCGAASVGELEEGAVVGTGSLRRRSQLLALRPDLDVRDLRGNVDTRLKRLADGDYDAVVVASAGLERLGRAGEGAPVATRELLPAAGQGCLALEAREDDTGIREQAAGLTDQAALVALLAERAIVGALDASCHTPVGALAGLEGGALELAAYVGLPDGGHWIRDVLVGEAGEPAALGRAVAERLLAAGAAELLAEAERVGRDSVRGVAEGTVYLVGAGPGDPGLLTRRALELIEQADVILYDRLVPAAALAKAREGTDLRYVGKEPGRPSLPQEDINAQLVELGGEGKVVVRLKGGDPFVFGRGGEEAEALAAAGVRFEIVPGVTAGVAAPAYAGIPVTHRDSASAVAFVTGHEDPEKDEPALDWEALGRFPGTLVMYMGVRNLDRIVERLLAAGRDPAEPAAVVERGTLPGQRSVAAPLGEIPAAAGEAGIGAPAIVLTGPAVELGQTLAWLERRPLHGQVVAVTRARAQASSLADRLTGLGAEVVETPTIHIQPRLDDPDVAEAVTRIREYALVCFTSPNGVRLLFDALRPAGHDARALAGATVAAIGPGTAAELERRGIVADVVAGRSIAEALVQALVDVPVEGRAVLVARASDARDVLPGALSDRGANVSDVALYDTVAEPLGDEQAEQLRRATYVTFTSSSTVRFFVESGGRVPDGARVASIGPVTSATARELGLTVHAEADRHDIDGLVAALLADAGSR